MAKVKEDDWLDENDSCQRCFWCGKYWPQIGVCDECSDKAEMKVNSELVPH